VTAPPEGDTTYKAVSAAEAFLATLDGTQRTSVTFAYTDAEQRVRWSNLPTGLFQRSGLRYGDLTAAQQGALKALLAVILSPEGYQQVLDNVASDEVLKNSGNSGKLIFGEAEHYVSILGVPSATSPWMVQFGGHHLAINATVVGGTITLAPSLTGGQPMTFEQGGASVRLQGAEVDAAFALVNALTAEQQKGAVLGSSFLDLVLGPGQDGKSLAPEGIKGSELTAEQQTKLLTLVMARVGMLNEEDAAARKALLSSELGETYFCWYGSTTSGNAAYYRVTGPSVVIEFSPQQMGGSAVQHTHAMYREPGNDYGAGLGQ
jgi:hypothetical protein